MSKLFQHCRNLSNLMKISTNDRREMIYSSLERSRRAESNGGEIMFLRVFCGEILSKTSKIGIFYISDTAPFDVLLNISATSDRTRMIYSSLESSHQDESNGA